MARKFPKIIHVTREGEGTESYLNVAEEGFANLGDTTEVALYQLIDVGEVIVSRAFEPKAKAQRGR